MKLTIFDCDGVLVNSEEIYLSAELEYLESIGASFEPKAYMQSFMGLSPSAWKAKLQASVEEKTGAPLQADFYDQIDQISTFRLEALLAEIPFARQTIDQIATLRCVASSTPAARLRWKLQRVGLIDLFDPHIFSTDLVQNGKPAPDLFLHVAMAMSASPHECIVVEDSVNGVIAGKAAGMHVIGFTAGNHCMADHGETLLRFGADIIIDKYEDLGAAIHSFGATISQGGAP
ncbi:HAD-IA family hydrolase [Rhizobium leguminosarum]|uniref:HAD family hydrolase n=1 Tax=Rhizobium leguminosarum TaxID=384 RepID=UPI001C97C34B|nr:HAD-IA family hydrolase [Rhizobium leguminosarum]MBY5760426.1 HAD-IA family hydrolase [Rhizobium leguminosarum]